MSYKWMGFGFNLFCPIWGGIQKPVFLLFSEIPRPLPPLTKIKLMDFTSTLFFRRPVINSPSTDTLKSVMRRRVVVWIVQVVGQTLQGKNI